MNKLLEEIAIDKEYIEETLKSLRDALNRSEKSVIELSAIGSFLHNIYTGMENILKRVLKFKNIKIPDSVSSHKDLLNVVVDKDIISQELSDKLDKYRGFRHFFIHAYGILLDEDELRPLAEDLPKVWEQFKHENENLIEKLKTSS